MDEGDEGQEIRQVHGLSFVCWIPFKSCESNAAGERIKQKREIDLLV